MQDRTQFSRSQFVHFSGLSLPIRILPDGTGVGLRQIAKALSKESRVPQGLP
jgi:hypothetical protein